jgi:hypothetical protein
MRRKRRVVANVVVGKADVDPTDPSHVAGVREGNQRGSVVRTPGLRRAMGGLRGTARRSTGINPKHRNPIDPRMPNLSPS